LAQHITKKIGSVKRNFKKIVLEFQGQFLYIFTLTFYAQDKSAA